MDGGEGVCAHSGWVSGWQQDRAVWFSPTQCNINMQKTQKALTPQPVYLHVLILLGVVLLLMFFFFLYFSIGSTGNRKFINNLYFFKKSPVLNGAAVGPSYLAGKQVAEIWAGSVEMLKKPEPNSSRENCGYSSVSMT